MSNPDKRWSWGVALGRGAGGAVGTAAAAGTLGALAGPAAPIALPIAMAVGAAGGFTSGFLGAALGHWWDDPPPFIDSPGSAALYSAVVAGLLAILIGSLTLGEWRVGDPRLAVAAVSAFSGFMAALSASLIDDLRARKRREQYMTHERG